MPLIYVHYPAGTLPDTARDALAEEITTVALDCEKLPTSAFVKSTTWVYFNELPSGHVYHGGKPGGTRIIALDVNAFEGGLDDAGKRMLIERLTEVIGKHTQTPPDARVPVYILLREIPPANWGVFGGTITLEDLRRPALNATPI